MYFVEPDEVVFDELVFFTVTLHEAFLPLEVLTVIVAVPALTPVTTPLEFTTATLLLLVDHETLSVEFEGSSVALRFRVLPASTLAYVLLSFIDLADKEELKLLSPVA